MTRPTPPAEAEPRTAWEADELSSSRTVAGGHGNPLRVPILNDAWTLAPALAIVVVVASGFAWGPRGLVAAALGSLLSLGNVWLLYRMGKKAVARAESEGGQEALSPLQIGLGAKTVALMLAVALLTRVGGLHTETAPLALGLLVSVLALIAAGLRGARVHR